MGMLVTSTRKNLQSKINNQKCLRFVISAGFVDGKAGEIFSHLQNVAISLIPRRRSFIDHHDALMGKSKLDKTGFSDIGTQPAGIFQIFVAGELRPPEVLDEVIQLVAL